MKRLGLIGVSTVAVIVGLSASSAHSRQQYKTEFFSKFVNRDSVDPNEKAFADAAVKAKCTVCHVGESKKNRNAFGRELAKLLHNEKDNTKIDEAFDSVLKMKADPNDPNSPTYGDLMKQGKLPSAQPSPEPQ
jgi:hypothetical protein